MVAWLGLLLTAMPAVAEEFNGFYQRFRGAVLAEDRQAVVALTALPFLIEGEEVGAQGFLRHYDGLFTPAAKTCFRRTRPVEEDGVWQLFCGQQIFLFRDDGPGFRFVEIGVDD